jgi:hypothetical protein
MSDQTPNDAVPEPQSDLQAQLINSGAHAQTVDAEAILTQMQAMQAMYEARQNSLEQEINRLKTQQGIPIDLVEAAKADLLNHLEARAAQYPNDDFSDVIKMVKNLPDSDRLTVNHTALLHDVVSEAVDTRPRHELGYIKTLAKGLHRLMLEKLVPSS